MRNEEAEKASESLQILLYQQKGFVACRILNIVFLILATVLKFTLKIKTKQKGGQSDSGVCEQTAKLSSASDSHIVLRRRAVGPTKKNSRVENSDQGAMQTYFYANYFLLVLAQVNREKKYVILGGNVDFADIFQSMKTGKKCKNVDIPDSIGLPQDGFPARLHFLSIFQAKQF